MTIFSVEFEQPLRADTVLLRNRQFVILIVKADHRPLPPQSRMDPAALIDRLRKALEAIREPAPPRSHVAIFSVVEAVDVAVEILAREGGPDAVAEFFGHAVDGDAEDAADEEMFAVDHAEIFRQKIAVEP